MRKLLLFASVLLAGFLLNNPSARAQPTLSAPQSDQQSPQSTKSVAGTVSSIENQGHSFSLEVKQGESKVTLQFVLDKDTRVQGNVNVGTPVTVEYVAMADKNVARTITVAT
ncbi:MAG: hypothetical protein LAO19_00225 [Acidobacteriia bacterium]|nr:hypothetical protein [Terriglobia bacterium]